MHFVVAVDAAKTRIFACLRARYTSLLTITVTAACMHALPLLLLLLEYTSGEYYREKKPEILLQRELCSLDCTTAAATATTAAAVTACSTSLQYAHITYQSIATTKGTALRCYYCCCYTYCTQKSPNSAGALVLSTLKSNGLPLYGNCLIASL
jgi:hypothetical protein